MPNWQAESHLHSIWIELALGDITTSTNSNVESEHFVAGTRRESLGQTGKTIPNKKLCFTNFILNGVGNQIWVSVNKDRSVDQYPAFRRLTTAFVSARNNVITSSLPTTVAAQQHGQRSVLHHRRATCTQVRWDTSVQ